MRNFNQPVTAALTSMAAFIGGNALAPIDYATAEMAPISSPQLFQECAHQATADPNILIVGGGWGIGPESVSVHQATAWFVLQDKQYGDIGNGMGADSYLPCNGSLDVKDTIQLKAGSFTTTVPNVSVELTVDNATMQSYSAPEASASGSFSYLQACKIAKQLRGRHASITAKVIEHRMYTDTNTDYASVKTTSTPFSTTLPCDKITTGNLVLVPEGPSQRPH